MAKTRSRRDRSARRDSKRKRTTRSDAPEPLPDRQCPACGAEYVARVEVCSDCDAPLFTPATPRPLAPEAHPWDVLNTDEPLHARVVGAALHAAGLRFDVHESATIAGPLCSVLVALADTPEALRIVEATDAGTSNRSPAEAVTLAQTLPLPHEHLFADVDAEEDEELEADEAEWDALPDLDPSDFAPTTQPPEADARSGGPAWSLADRGAIARGAGLTMWIIAGWILLSSPGSDPVQWALVVGLVLGGFALRARGHALTARAREAEDAA